MAPRGRPATRAHSRVQTPNVAAPPQLTQTPEGHVQTLPGEEAQTIPTSSRLPPTTPTPPPQTLPAQIKAVSHILDILERRSRDLVQQELRVSEMEVVAVARAATALPQDQSRPASPETVASRRRRSPPLHKEARRHASPVRREKHAGKPPTPPSPPTSNHSDDSSSDSSSSRSPSHTRRGHRKAKSPKKTLVDPGQVSSPQKSPAVVFLSPLSPT